MPKSSSHVKKLRFVTAAKMRRIEELAVSRYGIPLVALMESAGLACVEELLRQRFSERRLVTILCGAGNNGGDGFVIARHLFCRGIKVQVFHFPSKKSMSPETRVNYDAVRKLKIVYKKNPSIAVIQKKLCSSSWTVDALFGIGLSRPLQPLMMDVIDAMNRFSKRVMSVDIPSGLNADTGRPQTKAVEADITVTFGALKKAFMTAQSRKYTGHVILSTLCFPPQLLR